MKLGGTGLEERVREQQGLGIGRDLHVWEESLDFGGFGVMRVKKGWFGPTLIGT